MKNVYTLGHGFAHLTDHVQLSRPTTMYVKDGTMMDGRGIQNLVDTGNFTVNDEATQIVTYDEGDIIHDHFLCSDMTSLRDVNQGQKWQGKQAGFRRALSHGLGVVFVLDDNTYLYTTVYGVLTRLSDIQDALCWFMRFEPFHLHWSACRSRVGGESSDSIVQNCTSSLAQPQSMKVMGG